MERVEEFSIGMTLYNPSFLENLWVKSKRNTVNNKVHLEIVCKPVDNTRYHWKRRLIIDTFEKDLKGSFSRVRLTGCKGNYQEGE